MPFQTTTHFVSKPIAGPGQKLVHGRLVGPTDETYPPGTGGALPNRKSIAYATTVIVTVRDMNSGHTQTRRAAYVMGSDPEGDKAAKRSQINPGSSIMLGRPVHSDTAPELPPQSVQVVGNARTQDGDKQTGQIDQRTNSPVTVPEHISAEDQTAMDAHYSRLNRADQRAFLEEYPNYVPGPEAVQAVKEEGSTSEEASAATAQTQAPAGEARSAFVAPKGAAKGPTTSKQIGG